jgi:hypothetical protein
LLHHHLFNEELKMPKIQCQREQFTITIPKEYVLQAGLKKGDLMTISFNERGNIEFQKVKQ